MDDNFKRISAMFPGPEYRPMFMTEIFELVYHGGGGFSWSEVWNMSVPFRRFNLKKINEYLNKVQEAREEASGKQTMTSKTDMSKIKIPEHLRNANNPDTFISKIKNKS